MLVIARKIQQGFRVGDVRILILGWDQGKIKIGIDAPKEMLICRIPEHEPDTVSGPNSSPKPQSSSPAGA